MVCGVPAYIDTSTEEGVAQIKKCPSCGDTSTPPADLQRTLDITITAYELRTLTVWAERYLEFMENYYPGHVGQARKIFSTLIDRLSMQTEVPLTRAQDLADTRSALAESTGIRLVVLNPDGTCYDCHQPVNLAEYDKHVCVPPTA